MKKKLFTLTLIGFLIGLIMMTPNTCSATTGTIYIRANGSIDPNDGRIVTSNNVTYYLTTDLISDAPYTIVIERSNVILDGNFHKIQENDLPWRLNNGIGFVGPVRNVTVRNFELVNLYIGVHIQGSTSLNNVSRNNIYNCSDGVRFQGGHPNNNIIANNNMTDNNFAIRIGVDSQGNFNKIVNNIITSSSGNGVELSAAYKTTVRNNTITVPFTGEGTCIGVHAGFAGIGSHNTTIVRNTVQGITPISVTESDNNTISDNVINQIWANGVGAGIYLGKSSNNTVTLNVIQTSNNGIKGSLMNNSIFSGNFINHYNSPWGSNIDLEASHYNRIFNNTLNSTRSKGWAGHGLVLWASSNYNDIRNNIIGSVVVSSDYGYLNDGVVITASAHNTVAENTIRNCVNIGVKIEESNNVMVVGNNIMAYGQSGMGSFGIWIYGGLTTDNNFINNIINGTNLPENHGIELANSAFENTIQGNEVINNARGFNLIDNVHNNQIIENNVADNIIGIQISGGSDGLSSNNQIYHNNFVNNNLQVNVVDASQNTWDNGYPSGGNYWSDYTGTDNNLDGIGDTPYIFNPPRIDQDNYPLMKPWAAITDVAVLVVRRPDNLTAYRVYNVTTDSWTGWKALPRATCGSPAAAICNNELHMVIRDLNGDKLYHGYVNLATNAFSGWKLISGSTPSTPTLTSNGTVLCLVIRGSDNRTQYRTYSFSPSRSWGTWKTLARTTCDGPTAAMLGNNLHIITRSLDGTSLWHIIVKPNAGIVRNWISVSGSTPSKPALTANQTTNKLYLVVRGLNNRTRWRTYDSPADSWAGWNTVPTGATCDGPTATALDNKLHIIIRSMTGTTLRHGYITLATSAFSGWTLLSGSTPSTPTLTS